MLDLAGRNLRARNVTREALAYLGTLFGQPNAVGRGDTLMEFRLLGIVETRVDGSPVDIGPRRQRLVLAVLALEANRLVSVDRLVELSWPTAPPRTPWNFSR